MRAGLGQGMRCLHSSPWIQRREYCGPGTWLDPDPALVALWRQHPRDTRAMAGIPTTEAEPRALPTTTHSVSPDKWKVTRQHTHWWTAPARKTQCSSPSRRAPIPPALHCSSEMQLRTASGGLYTNNQGADPAPDRAVTTTEPGAGPVQYPGQALAVTSHTSYQKGNDQYNWAKRWQAPY